ncbi:hypothetical protein BLNAU_1292 [Blattamonas nauphoetae]|uniref:Uncharacterized protein n=1 Tax=Blattamonas nauphoetae TaxID=2049346 RepID=A0ABQ9YJA9_9EUKA|nr:hypothetical protein BLNAU_1292 [Blattamonas nauphoetae]
MDQMTQFMVSSSFALAYTDFLHFWESGIQTRQLLQNVVTAVSAWKMEDAVVLKRGQQILIRLCEEGFEDEMELPFPFSGLTFRGSRIASVRSLFGASTLSFKTSLPANSTDVSLYLVHQYGTSCFQSSVHNPSFKPLHVSDPTPPDMDGRAKRRLPCASDLEALWKDSILSPLNPDSATIPPLTTDNTFDLCGGEHSGKIVGHLIKMSLNSPTPTCTLLSESIDVLLNPPNPTHSPPFAVLPVSSSADGIDAAIAQRGRHNNTGACPLSPPTPNTPTLPHTNTNARFGVVSSRRRISCGQRWNGAWKGFAMEGEDCATRRVDADLQIRLGADLKVYTQICHFLVHFN